MYCFDFYMSVRAAFAFLFF